MAISMLKIRRPLGRLIFNMGIAIPGKTVFLIETAPWSCKIQADLSCLCALNVCVICKLLDKEVYLWGMPYTGIASCRYEQNIGICNLYNRIQRVLWNDNILTLTKILFHMAFGYSYMILLPVAWFCSYSPNKANYLYYIVSIATFITA